MKRFMLSVFAALAVALVPSQALTNTDTWVGGISDNMATHANWLDGVRPVDGSSNLTLIFPNSATNFSPAQTIAGSGLDLESMQISGNYTMMTGGSNGYAFQNLGAAPSMTVNGNAQFLANVAIFDPMTASVTGALSFDGLLAGGGDLTLTGTFANFTIGDTGSNTYTGTLTVNGSNQGTLSKTGGFALQGDLVIDGGGANVTTNVANQFGPNSDLTVTNSAYFQMFASTPQTVRDVTVNNTGQVVLNNGTLTVTGTMTTASGFGLMSTNSADVIDLAGGLRTVDVQAGATMSIQGILTNGRIDKTGTGTVQMFNPGNTFTGQNIVSGGTLAGAPNSIGSDVLNNATVELGSGTLNAPVISGTGNVVIQGFVQFNAAQTYTGGTDVAGAFSTLTGDTNTLQGSFTSGGFGTLQISQAFNGAFGGSLSGNLQVVKQGAGVVALGGVNTHTQSTSLAGGGLVLTTDNALGTSLLAINTGSAPNTLEAMGSRTYANPLFIQSDLSIVGSGDFNFTDTAAKTLSTNLVHNSTGSTKIAGKFTVGTFATLTVNSGTLELGNPAVVGGFTAQGAIAVNGGTLKVNSLNFTTLPDVTLASGTLDAPNGYAIPLGAALQGNGGVTGRVASANGSSIIANGNLGLGDGTHVAGVNLDGELYTNQNTVTLFDSNQAVLGSLTDLGTSTQNGTLASANGFVLNFGRNITGRGQIQSNNTLADAAIINGDVNGDSAINFLEFTGYVKGVGTFNNVAFSGTFSPGLSPILSTVGTVTLMPSNVLDMELGGLTRGSQYDAIDITGLLTLDGTLKVSLINTFNPSLGDQFLLFQGPQTGLFDNFDYTMAPLSAGLMWDTNLLYSNGILQVSAVPEPATILLLAMVGCGLLLRPRR